ncbi:hypothetical protein ACIQZG_08290 [Lysinibacillus sp. NPDC096418]|uniref:hypothetical protein n=1 Tax=Lysinibacillus sp. NPDC096418 TaxID=3364138 RepID=UPI0037F277CB
MPILNEINTQVVFGTGDIAVQTGCRGQKSLGVMQFTEVEPLPIGQHLEIGTNEKIRIGNAPITLVFNKIESLDVVINQLLKLRGKMGGN